MNTSIAGTTSVIGTITITIAIDLGPDGPVAAGHGANSIKIPRAHAAYTILPIDSIRRGFENESGS
jgi:hypothetical protein